MKNFSLRLLTGVVYVALIVLGIMVNQYTFLCLFSIIVVLCLGEFYHLVNTQKGTRINLWYNSFGGLLLFASTYLYTSNTLGYSVLLLYLLYIVAILVSALYEKRQDTITHIAYVFFGQCYIALPLSLLNLLAFQHNISEIPAYYYLFILSLFVFIWINDTGAYLVGMLLGKHRLFPRISPKKSWEGFFGGLVFTIAASFIFAHFEHGIPYYHWIGISILVVLFGTWGDLVESLIKRTLEVKDSGKSLPGHGGFLDRFDSLLLAVYAILFYIYFFI